MGPNHPVAPKEAAQETVETLAAVQHPQFADVTTEAQSRRTEPGARDTGGDKTQRTAGRSDEVHHLGGEEAEST